MGDRFLRAAEIAFATGYCACSGIRKKIVYIGQPARVYRGILYIALFILAAAPAVYLGWGHEGGFNSPDENAAYLAAQMWAEDGRLYLQDVFTELNPPVPTGPRGFTQHNGRSVPIYPLGHPLFLGVAHELFGEAAPIALAVIPGLLFLSLALLLRVLAPTAPRYLGFMFLSVMPLWYWASRVYMNLALTLLFISLGLLCFALAVHPGL